MRRLGIGIAVTAFALAMLSTPAAANSGTGQPPPFPDCHPFIPANGLGPGFPPTDLPSTGPCTQTGHFGQSDNVATPGGPCSPPEAIAILATGNGIFHSNVNGADDWWLTSTFEGNFNAYVFLGFDTSGAPILGPLVFTGHEEEWFGDSLNANNFVDHATMNLVATDVTTGQTMAIHANFHDSSTGGSPYVFGLPTFLEATHFVFHITC